MSLLPKSKLYSRRSVGVMLVVGVLAGVTVGGGLGVIAAASTKTVTVCANKTTNVLRYAKDGKCVTKNETKVVLNQTGAKGDTGAAGAKGDTGDAGAKGDTGASGQIGLQGPQGLTGVKGDTGLTGAKGDAGAAGTNGTNGTNGAAGTNGTNGTNATVAITQQSVCDGSDAGMVADELCKIGMKGPGGGHIFFVDYNDQYPGLDYLEAAPKECESRTTWSSVDSSFVYPIVTAASGWAAHAVGRGQANTTAILAVYTSDTTSNNAAKYADSLNCGSKTDWFLGSVGEMTLMKTNLLQAGVGGFDNYFRWSSTDYDWTGEDAPNYCVMVNEDGCAAKFELIYVRPIRSF
jgi:hypothetical protein